MSGLNERLIETNLAPSEFYLSINHVLRAPAKFRQGKMWSLPSRLFAFPIAIDKDQLHLRHPDLKDHPFVHYAQDMLKDDIVFPANNRRDYGSWHHAVDLVTDGFLDALFETANFTTPQDIAAAVIHCLCCPPDDARAHLSTKQARTALKRLGHDEPNKRCSTLKQISVPTMSTSDAGTERWPVNGLDGAGDERHWTVIHALKDGYFSIRTGHLEWTPAGRDFYAGTSFGLLI